MIFELSWFYGAQNYYQVMENVRKLSVSLLTFLLVILNHCCYGTVNNGYFMTYLSSCVLVQCLKKKRF